MPYSGERSHRHLCCHSVQSTPTQRGNSIIAYLRIARGCRGPFHLPRLFVDSNRSRTRSRKGPSTALERAIFCCQLRTGSSDAYLSVRTTDDPLSRSRPHCSWVRYETMHATLALVRDKYGGVEAYVKNFCGLTDDDISTVRSNLVVSAKARM